MASKNSSNGRVGGYTKLTYTISEVEAEQMPSRYERGEQWQQFYYEIKLRLERTPRSRALRAEFEDVKLARTAHTHLTKRFRKYHGTGVVECRTREEGSGRGALYIRRGEQYEKKGVSVVAGSKVQDFD